MSSCTVIAVNDQPSVINICSNMLGNHVRISLLINRVRLTLLNHLLLVKLFNYSLRISNYRGRSIDSGFMN